MNHLIRQYAFFLFLLPLFIVAPASCSSNNQSSKASQSPPPKGSSNIDAGTSYVRNPVVWFEPTDFSTDTGTSTPKLGIQTTANAIDSAMLDLITKKVSLVLWPELTAVDASAVLEDVPPSDHETKRYYVVLQTANALENRWHLIKLELLPSGVSFQPAARSVALPDGSQGSRFNPGSELNLQDVRFCEKEGGVHRVLFRFSENCVIDESYNGTLVQIAQEAILDCAADEVPTAAHPGREIGYVCKGFDKAKSVSLTFDKQIQSAKGESVKNLSWTGNTAQKDFASEQGREIEEGCLTFDMR